MCFEFSEAKYYRVEKLLLRCIQANSARADFNTKIVLTCSYIGVIGLIC